MNAPLRRGQCPTLAAPMRTGDGLLARLNPVASGLSPKALVALCESAQRRGNGIVEVTARGSLQIRGLTAKSAGLLAAEVDALGIEVRTGVPVETGPLAGLDPEEIADPRPLAERIRKGIADAGLTERLGPKVSVVVDSGGHSGLSAVAADVRLTAEGSGAGVMWGLAVAGDARAILLGHFDEETACDVALAILTEVAAIGPEGRARNLSSRLLQEIFVGAQRLMLPPSVLPDISPAKGEMSGRTEGGAKERQASANSNALDRILPLIDGRFAISAALPFGHVEADRLIDFVQQSQSLGAAEVRLAPPRSLILICPSELMALAVREAARNADLIVDTGDPRLRIAACPGAPACASGNIPARVMAAEIAKAMPEGTGLDLHVSGCEKRCANPGHKGLTLLGFPDNAGLVLESAGKTPLAVVAKERAAGSIGAVARLIATEGRPGESEADCLARIGKDKLIEAFRQEP